MKFKFLIVTLNIVIIISFISFFIMPLLAYPNNITAFLMRYWFFPPIFIVLLIFVNILYFRNKNIIENVESGDWSALCHALEVEVFDKHRTSLKNLKLLSEVQLLLSDFAGLKRLETFVRANCSEYLAALAPNFAGGKLLSGQYAELYNFVSNLVRSGKKDEWVAFYVPFSLQMQKDYSRASEEFKKLLNTFSEPILNSMTAYFYYEVLKKHCKCTENERSTFVSEAQNKIKSSYSLDAWSAYTAKKKQEMHVLVFKKVIDDTTNWVFRA